MWESKFIENLEKANQASSQYTTYFDAFTLAAERAVTQVSDTIDPLYVSGLEARVRELEQRLGSTIEQLNQVQRRNRDMNEEQYMKTSAVQQLSDEIIALNLQLNVSHDKQCELEKENKDLIARWVAKVESDAFAMGLS